MLAVKIGVETLTTREYCEVDINLGALVPAARDPKD